MNTRRLALALFILAAFFTTACSEPLEFADWTIPVPEGTRIIEYAPVPMDERDPDAIQLIEDLVIGDDPTDPNTRFYRPSAVVASAEGRIFVADAGNNHVRVFDPAGKYMRTFGGEGQGPGEFESLAGMTVAGDLLVVFDRSGRHSTWTLDGDYVADHRRESRAPRRRLFDGWGAYRRRFRLRRLVAGWRFLRRPMDVCHRGARLRVPRGRER